MEQHIGHGTRSIVAVPSLYINEAGIVLDPGMTSPLLFSLPTTPFSTCIE